MARADTINAPRGGKLKAIRECAAIGYIRRSTDRQEQSIPDQKKAIENTLMITDYLMIVARQFGAVLRIYS